MGNGQGCRRHEQIDQEHREQNRDRVIDTGLDLEDGGDTRPQLETAQVQQRRDGRRVGRSNNRTDQQPSRPGGGKKQCCRRSDDYGRDDYADSSQGEGRPKRTSDGTRIGA